MPTRAVSPSLQPVTRDGRTRYEYRYDKAHFSRLERGSVAYVSYGDRLMVSTFPDYAAFAATYRESAADPSAHDAAVTRLAQQLTAHDRTPRDKAKTLYDWVRRNVRYVAINVGRGAVVPHSASAVLANRYGDCKDHVALYGALLDAAGVRNEPALISSGTIYTLPSVPGYGVINHVITWLPDLQQYADSTASNVEFGFLPSSDMNRPTVLVGEGVLARTPATAFMTRSTDLSIKVEPDGSASFTYRLEAAGASAEQARAMLRTQTPAQREESIQAELRSANLRGTATLATNDLDVADGPLVITMKGTLEESRGAGRGGVDSGVDESGRRLRGGYALLARRTSAHAAVRLSQPGVARTRAHRVARQFSRARHAGGETNPGSLRRFPVAVHVRSAQQRRHDDARRRHAFR